tara:strand:+ start:700 stop:1422 length:723 start_codon:yes stop_codon:yes gene_type:complete
MAHEINVNITHAKEDINISTYPDGLVFNPSHKTMPFVLAEPSNSVSVIGHHVNVVSSNTYADNSVSVINVGSQLNITLGTLVESPFQDQLDSFTYQFDDFVDPGIASAWGGDGWDASLKFGDVVYLESDLTENANDWGAKCKKAFVSNVDYGAFNTLFIFISHIGNTLILMHKGFFDLDNENISQWTAGRALYLNENHILDITPTGQSENWVRSLGYCVPNKDSKKRIWFEPDSTYIKIN